jgi:hypothetical protein
MIQIIAGLTYGLTLDILSFMLMGAGHGTYLPFAISSAPFGLVNYPPFTVLFGLIAIPTLWTFVALAAEQGWHKAFRVVLIVHYVGVALSVINPIDGDWSYLGRMMRFSGPIVVLWSLIYVVGQVLVWYWFLKVRPQHKPPNTPLQPTAEERVG